MYWTEYNSWGKTRILIKAVIVISIFVVVIFLFNNLILSSEQTILDSGSDSPPLITKEPPTPPGNNRLVDKGRHVLTLMDESEHRFSKREWWYFNVFFTDSKGELVNWSMIISFNKMASNDIRFLQRDNFFLVLYDNLGTYYSYNSLNNPRGSFQAGQEGVELSFGPNFAKGTYPQWMVHAEDQNNELITDLIFTADFLPVWVEGRSSNLVFGGFMAGDYYIPRCNVSGTLQWKQKTYNITGIGYHDHVWEANIPRFITNGWEWFNFHFDNGWEMYVSKFNLRRIRDVYAGAIIISPNNRNLVEFNTFDLKPRNLNSATGIARMKYPQEYTLVAERDDMKISLEIKIYNICEIVWPRARTGMFEGPCYVSGTFSWDQECVTLQGFGMSEVTIVEYLLQRPKILDQLRAK
ncbi:MAG: hypothetical protein KKC68_05615 [Candidatus Thermoplasmatota archaeon]|nr:hypothetical protein [Candidatus Thermoplasmatota archaeon]MBU1941233.1 hypothetical protein [Candidatus Thermoplasmatota archaeon]